MSQIFDSYQTLNSLVNPAWQKTFNFSKTDTNPRAYGTRGYKHTINSRISAAISTAVCAVLVGGSLLHNDFLNPGGHLLCDPTLRVIELPAPGTKPAPLDLFSVTEI